MKAYETIMAAKAVDDIPIGTQEWIVDGGFIRSFTVQRHEIGNIIVIQYQNGANDYMKLHEFQQRVNGA